VQPPRAISSRAGQEGGCGEEGRHDLKMMTAHDDCVDITPPFRAYPHALETTLFEGGGRMILAQGGGEAQFQDHQDEGSLLQISTLGRPTICNDLV
jgi:hypothetical protein